MSSAPASGTFDRRDPQAPPGQEVGTRASLLLAGTLLLGVRVPIGAQSEPPIIQAIELHRLSVFDSAEASNWFFRSANRLHYRTREQVIRAALLFHAGEPVDSAALAESARNLRALAIFSDVTIDTIGTDSGLVVRVTTRDAWTAALGGDIQSAGDQVSYNAAFIDVNFLGTDARILARYGKYPDYTALELEYAQPRLIANQIGIDLYHQERSDGSQSIATVSDPFRAIASPSGATLTVRAFDGRVLQFAGGQPVPADTLQNRTEQLLFEGARALHADARGYVRIGVIAQVLRNDYVADSASVLIPQHVIFSIGPTLAITRAHFKATTNYEHLHLTEDVDLSPTLSLGALVVTGASGVYHRGVAPFATVRAGTEIPGGFGILAGAASGLFSSTGLDSGTVTGAATVSISFGGRRTRLLLHAEAGEAHNMAPVDQFDLGFGFGPRAFGAHAFTGDRYRFATAEYRFTIAPEVAHILGVGVATFGDYGGAWFTGSPERTGYDAGIGLRLGPTRQGDLRTVRIDIARRFANDVLAAGWVVVIGKGFTFTLAQ